MERRRQCLLAVAILVTEAQAHACTPNPCRNGGTCRSYANGYRYSCSCRDEFRGQECEIPTACIGDRPAVMRVNTSGVFSIQFFDFPQAYANCQWLIAAEPGHTVFLQVVKFNKIRKMGDNCRYESLQFFDGRTIDSALIKKICDSDMKSLHSTRNQVLIQFSSFNATQAGFELRFQAIQTSSTSTNQRISAFTSILKTTTASMDRISAFTSILKTTTASMDTLEPSPKEKPEDGETSLSTIIGVVAGVLCLLATVILGLSICKRNRNSSASSAFRVAYSNDEALTYDRALAPNQESTDDYSLAIATSSSDRATASADFRSSANVAMEAYQNVRTPTVDFRSSANVAMETYQNARTPTVDFRSSANVAMETYQNARTPTVDFRSSANVAMETYQNARTPTVDFRSSANVAMEIYQNVPAPNQNATDIYSYATACSSLATAPDIDYYGYSILVDQSRTTPTSDKLQSYAHIPLQASGWSADDPPPMYSEVADAYHILED